MPDKMLHLDHSLVNDPPSPPPEPAVPILASHLLELEEKQRRRFAGNEESGRLSTACRGVDELLGGGVERGVMLGVSSSVEGLEGKLISLHLLASALISGLNSSKTGSIATVIDTTGSFPLTLLFSVLKSRILVTRSLSAQNAVRSGHHPVQGRELADAVHVDAEVQRCLEMVAISRVFDVEGLWEVLGEVRHDTHSEAALNDQIATSGARAKVSIEPEIHDSQEEDATSETEQPVSTPAPERSGAAKDGLEDGTELIIIDNMTHLINELFSRKERSDAHALLTLLSSTLHTLTKTGNILTILHNTSTPSNTTPAYQAQPSRQPLHATTPRSIFASAATKPALGQIFSQFPDLHLFLHSLPRGRGDAEMLYGPGEESSVGESSGEAAVGYCTVVEVLKDECAVLGSDRHMNGGRRFAWREQRWTAVDVDEPGTALVTAIQDRGGMKQRGVDGGLSGGVGNVAKIWGFGGRRA